MLIVIINNVWISKRVACPNIILTLLQSPAPGIHQFEIIVFDAGKIIEQEAACDEQGVDEPEMG